MNRRLFWCLHRRALRRFNPASGSSRIASSAYQNVAHGGSTVRRGPLPNPPRSRTNGKRTSATPVPWFAWATDGLPPVQSLRIGRGREGPGTSNHSLYRTEPSMDPRYPEGNFGVNQLPSGSIGLSPLSARRTNDLHVSTVDGPPPGFPPASPRARIDHRFSGPNACALTRSPLVGRRAAVPPPRRRVPAFTFVPRWGFRPIHSRIR